MEYFQLTKEIVKEKTLKIEITENYLNEVKEAIINEFDLNEYEISLIDENFIKFGFTTSYEFYKKLTDDQIELLDKTKNFEITINEFVEEYIANDVLNNGYEDKTEYIYTKTGEYSYSILENES